MTCIIYDLFYISKVATKGVISMITNPVLFLYVTAIHIVGIKQLETR